MDAQRTANIGDTERGARIASGAMATTGGAFMLLSSPFTASFLILVAMLLIAAGTAVLVTGVTAHCPVYARLGHISPSIQGVDDRWDVGTLVRDR